MRLRWWPPGVATAGVLAAFAVALLGSWWTASAAHAEGPPEVRTASGAMPQQGFALIIWGGGPVEAIPEAVAARGGCDVRVVWDLDAGGEFRGYIFGAPAFVQQGFLELHRGGELGEQALMVQCAPPPPPSPWVEGVDLDAVYAYALELINEARAAEGVAPVVLGTNPAAQRHAEDLAEHCARGHWGSDGLLPYMRYSLAGGYHDNGENVSAWGPRSGCGDGTRRSDAAAVRGQTQGILESPGHRANLLNPEWRQVSLGFARRGNATFLVQQFEGDYAVVTELPRIDGHGVLTLAGYTTNGATLRSNARGSVSYHPLPAPPPAGLWSHTYGYRTPRSVMGLSEDAGHIKQTSERFEVEADLTQPPRGSTGLHGPGVYTVSLFGETAAGDTVRLVQYSLFVGDAPGEPLPLIPARYRAIIGGLELELDEAVIDEGRLRFSGILKRPVRIDTRRPLATVNIESWAAAWLRRSGSPVGPYAVLNSAYRWGGPWVQVYSPHVPAGARLPTDDGRITQQVAATRFVYDGERYELEFDLAGLVTEPGVITASLHEWASNANGEWLGMIEQEVFEIGYGHEGPQVGCEWRDCLAGIPGYEE